MPSIPFFKRIFQSIYRQTQRQARLPSPRRLASFRRNFSLSWSLVGPQLLRLLTAAWPAPFFHTSTSTVQRGGRSARTQQLDANPLLFLYSLRRPQWASSPDCPRQPTSTVQQQTTGRREGSRPSLLYFSSNSGYRQNQRITTGILPYSGESVGRIGRIRRPIS